MRSNHHITKLSGRKLCVLAGLFTTCVYPFAVAGAEEQKVEVAAGTRKVATFAGDPAGNYQLTLTAPAGQNVQNADFNSDFKDKTLWMRASATSYNVAYTDGPKPPPVGVAGTLGGGGGGGGGGNAQPSFNVDVRGIGFEAALKMPEMIFNYIPQNAIIDPANPKVSLWADVTVGTVPSANVTMNSTRGSVDTFAPPSGPASNNGVFRTVLVLLR